METRVSFFIVAGYLVPGMVFGFVLSPLAIDLLYKSTLPALSHFVAAVLKSDAAVAVSVITLFGFCSLACAFAIGILLSDMHFKLLEVVGLLRRESDLKHFNKWSASENLANLLGKDWQLREAYVIALTQGPDIYGYAARNRMLGASGFAISTAGVIYLLARWFWTSGVLVVLGMAFILVGASLVRRYREWIAAYAALFLLTERLVKTQPKGSGDNED
jgi:hypothetical protein